jgi:hypothetical protein
MTKCALLRANNKTMILVNGAKLLAYFIKWTKTKESSNFY